MPGHNESAGKRKPSKTRKGNKYLQSALLEASQSVCRSDNYLGALYRRIAARKGGRKAAVAVAHAIMKIAYHLLTRNEDYRDLGADYFEKRQQDVIVKQSVRRLESLGFTVTIAAPEAS